MFRPPTWSWLRPSNPPSRLLALDINERSLNVRPLRAGLIDRVGRIWLGWPSEGVPHIDDLNSTNYMYRSHRPSLFDVRYIRVCLIQDDATVELPRLIEVPFLLQD